MITVHKLKTWPVYFDLVISGVKTFEIRKNDRDFKVGDVLILQRFDPETQGYDGQEIAMRVNYITDFNQKDGVVVLGIA